MQSSARDEIAEISMRKEFGCTEFSPDDDVHCQRPPEHKLRGGQLGSDVHEGEGGQEEIE